jgi:hypothetical protein
MALFTPFAPYLPTTTVNLAVTAAAQAVPVVDTAARMVNFRIANVGTQTVFFLAAGQGQAAPVATAANGIPLLPNTAETFTLPPNPQISAIAASTGSTLYVTSGEGV